MVARLMPYTITAFGLSDIGLVRQNNEDVWGQLPQLNFYVLADGMGGHQAGEVAAREAVNSLNRVVKRKIKAAQQPLSIVDLEEMLRQAIRYVNGVIYKLGKKEIELRGMGTTLCCLLFHGNGVVFAHVGDSRIYRFRNAQLEQLTKDHSLLCELVDQGQINEQQASEFLYKNIITRAIGTEPKVEPTLGIGELQDDDIYLMCSDGLSDLLAPDEIEKVLIQTDSLKEAAESLIALANEKGGRDNITVVLTKVEGSDDSEDIPR